VIDVHATCQQMAGATLTTPFGPQTAVYKVGGKIFAVVGVADADSINLKAEPHEVTALVDTYQGVTRGYHMNKKHWVTVSLGRDVPDSLVAELIEDSYDLIVDKLPARLRP
jgi:predicted DNA-binding protein (MmcQ/YjbR family)